MSLFYRYSSLHQCLQDGMLHNFSSNPSTTSVRPSLSWPLSLDLCNFSSLFQLCPYTIVSDHLNVDVALSFALLMYVLSVRRSFHTHCLDIFCPMPSAPNSQMFLRHNLHHNPFVALLSTPCNSSQPIVPCFSSVKGKVCSYM